MARRISLDSADFDFAGPFEDEFCRFANPAGRKRLGVCLAECSSGEDRPVDVEVLDNEAVARHAEPESLFHTLGQGPKGLLGLPLTTGRTIDLVPKFQIRHWNQYSTGPTVGALNAESPKRTFSKNSKK